MKNKKQMNDYRDAFYCKKSLKMSQGSIGKDNTMEKEKSQKDKPSTKHYTDNQALSKHETHG
jgi:hypothetical protein